jgi:hypothetical protein
LWRPLSLDEVQRAAALLRRASAVVRHQVPSVDTRVATGQLSADVVSGVVVEMVLRVLDPDKRITARTVEDYSERYADARVSVEAGIFLTAAELAALQPAGARSGMYVVDLGTPAY